MSDAATNDHDRYLSIAEATESVFKNTVTPFSVRRWTAKGVGSPPIKLPAKRIGGQYFIKESDAREFLDAISDPELFRRKQATKRSERAKRRLQRAGA